MKYCMYLRKSREDVEYERKSNDYDTLERHKKRLMSYAREINIEIDKIYEEVVSGDSISERPIIKQLLLDIETLYDGVLVVDVQRLTRGGYTDQGRIIDTFKYSNTIIVTPDKTFDLNIKADEEYFADKLSYSRKEYDGIKKRLSEGRKDSVYEGKFVGSKPAYGYKRYKLSGQKGFSLEIVEDQAEIVRLIFQLCLDGKGTYSTATYLNNLGIKSPNGSIWRKNMIRELLHNPVYCGYVTWQARKTVKTIDNGKIKTNIKRSKNGEFIKAKGIHEKIVTEEDFNKTQEILKKCSTKYVPDKLELKNPLAGIIRCSVCNKVLARRGESYSVYFIPRKSGLNPKYYPSAPILHCTTGAKCGISSNRLDQVEIMVIDALKVWVKDHKKIALDYQKNKDTLLNKVVNKIEIVDNELLKEKIKLDKIRDLLEEGIYDKKTFRERSEIIESNIKNLKSKKEEINTQNETIKLEKIESLIPIAEKCIKNYYKLSISDRNKMLHSLIDKVLYTKTKNNNENDLTLDLYMKI